LMKKRWFLLVALVTAILASLVLAGCGTSQSGYDELLAEKTALEADLQTLNTFYTNLQSEQASLQAEYDAVNDELTAIKEVYPPRDFASPVELEDWLLANDVSGKPVTSSAEAWIGRALEVQADALADGYVVSVDYDGPDEDGFYMVFCTTIVNGSVYYWDPETDDVTKDNTLEAVK